MKRCCRCSAVATFDSPRDYCDEHWARWWGGYIDNPALVDDSVGPSEEMYREALASIIERTRAERKR